MRTPVVRQYMTPEVRTATPDMRLSELARLLVGWCVSGAPVIDEKHQVIGVVSLVDLLSRAAGIEPLRGPQSGFYQSLWVPRELDALPLDSPDIHVREVMNSDILRVHPEEPLQEAARLMCEHRVHRLIVTGQELRAVGVLTTMDVTRAFAELSLVREG